MVNEIMFDNDNVEFNFPQGNTSIIKVIGVGGGGCNAVNNMFNKGIHDVAFVVCNTDNKALNDSVVPAKLQLGKDGLGAGNDPVAGKKAAEESLDEVKTMLSDGTKMVFITAGMGGGTGTGAAPVIAKTAKEMGILTVGIVTIPFRWEGIKKIDQALDGVEEMSKNVDALLVINNERLREIYPELTVLDAFAKADDTLCNAARSIAEIITMHGIINLDFKDVKTVLQNGGVAIMSTGYGSGDGRISKAIEDALHSPLLNNNDIYNSQKILLHISFCGDESDGTPSLMMEEMGEIHEFMEKMKTADIVETKWGLSVDSSLKEKVKVTKALFSLFKLRNYRAYQYMAWVNNLAALGTFSTYLAAITVGSSKNLLLTLPTAAGTVVGNVLTAKLSKKYEPTKLLKFCGPYAMVSAGILFLLCFAEAKLGLMFFSGWNSIFFYVFYFLFGLGIGVQELSNSHFVVEYYDYLEWQTGDRMEAIQGIVPGWINTAINTAKEIAIPFLIAWVGYQSSDAGDLVKTMQAQPGYLNTCLWLLGFLLFGYALSNLFKAIILKTLYDVEGEKKEQMYRELETMRAARREENAALAQETE